MLRDLKQLRLPFNDFFLSHAVYMGVSRIISDTMYTLVSHQTETECFILVTLQRSECGRKKSCAEECFSQNNSPYSIHLIQYSNRKIISQNKGARCMPYEISVDFQVTDLAANTKQSCKGVCQN